MYKLYFKFIILFAPIISLTTQLQGVSRDPYIGYVYPAGGQQGSTIELIVGGIHLEKIKSATFSGEGIEIISAKYFNIFLKTNDEKKELTNILRALQSGRDPEKASKRYIEKAEKRLKKIEQLNKDNNTPKSHSNIKKRSKNELLYIKMSLKELLNKINSLSKAEYQALLKTILKKRNKLQTAPAIAKLAIIKIKIAKNAKKGFREFRIISRNGISNPLTFQVNDLKETQEDFFHKKIRNIPYKLEINSIANGIILPGEVTTYTFSAKANTTYSFKVLARRLIPFLSDAVPGWFQAIISIKNQKGECVAYNDDHLFNPDPQLSFTPKNDGEYTISIYDAIYRGREDFVYRLLFTKEKSTHEKLLPLQLPYKLSNVKEKNSKPQKIEVQSLVNGSISKPGECDTYTVKLKKGEKTAIEIFARRLNSPMDSLIKIYDKDGNFLILNDDYNWPNIGIKTHLSDSYILFTPEKTGTYYIKISDTQNKGGDLYKYKLRVSKPYPDFTVYIMPSAINVPYRLTVPVTFFVFRKDGFNGDIKINLEKNSNLTIDAGLIPSGVDKVTLTLRPIERIMQGIYTPKIQASATINDKKIIHNVIPADDIMQAFLYRHIVPAQKCFLYVTKPWYPLKKIRTNVTPISAYPNKQYIVKIAAIPTQKSKYKFSFTLHSPPLGVTIKETKLINNFFNIKLDIAKNAKEWKGYLVIDVTITIPPKNKKSKPHLFPLGSLPAIPFHLRAN